MAVDLIQTPQGEFIHVHSYHKTIKRFGLNFAKMILDCELVITDFCNGNKSAGDSGKNPYWSVTEFNGFLTLDIGEGFRFGKSKWSIFLVGMDVIKRFVNDDSEAAQMMRDEWNRRFDDAGLLTEYNRLSDRDE